jgi:hypothetical protein
VQHLVGVHARRRSDRRYQRLRHREPCGVAKLVVVSLAGGGTAVVGVTVTVAPAVIAAREAGAIFGGITYAVGKSTGGTSGNSGGGTSGETATPQGRVYSKHFLDRRLEALNHQVSGDVIDGVIDNAKPTKDTETGYLVYYSRAANVTVVREPNLFGEIMSAHTVRP